MITEKTILIPIYRHRLRICVCDSINEAIDKYPEIPSNSEACTITYNEGNTLVVVEPNNIPVIVHECEHIKNDVWIRIGHVPDLKNQETDAYLIEHIFEEIMKVVRKHLKKGASLER